MSFQNTLKCMNKLKVKPVECINKPSTTSSPLVSEWSNEIDQLNKIIEEIKENSNVVENSPIPVQSEPSQRVKSEANIETIKKKKLELQLKMNQVRPEQPNKPKKPNKPYPKKVIISNIANTKTK